MWKNLEMVLIETSKIDARYYNEMTSLQSRLEIQTIKWNEISSYENKRRLQKQRKIPTLNILGKIQKKKEVFYHDGIHGIPRKEKEMESQ